MTTRLPISEEMRPVVESASSIATPRFAYSRAINQYVVGQTLNHHYNNLVGEPDRELITEQEIEEELYDDFDDLESEYSYYDSDYQSEYENYDSEYDSDSSLHVPNPYPVIPIASSDFSNHDEATGYLLFARLRRNLIQNYDIINLESRIMLALQACSNFVHFRILDDLKKSQGMLTIPRKIYLCSLEQYMKSKNTFKLDLTHINGLVVDLLLKIQMRLPRRFMHLLCVR